MIINEAGRSACLRADTQHGVYVGEENIERARTYLILDQELDTLDGSSSGLGDGGRYTTHCKHELVADTCKPIARKPQSIHVYDAVMATG
jgi:hypothetical protein